VVPPSSGAAMTGSRLALQFPDALARSEADEPYEGRIPGSGCVPVKASSIYIVDDEEGLAELYTLFLEGTGYRVRAFTNRAEALSALSADETRPDLLILDYLGHPLPVEGFMVQCRIIHPHLRFLMASGLNEFEVRHYSVKPNRFLQKPFTAEEFLREVRATLDA
jgi:DNA-binding response OmpR family regulator